MKLDKTTMRFETDGATVEVDLVDAVVRLQKIRDKAVDSDDEDQSILDGVKSWFQEEWGISVTSTQAFQIRAAIEVEFINLKKNSALLLGLGSGLALTQPKSRNAWLGRWMRFFFPSSWRRRKFKQDLSDLILRQIASENS